MDYQTMMRLMAQTDPRGLLGGLFSAQSNPNADGGPVAPPQQNAPTGPAGGIGPAAQRPVVGSIPPGGPRLNWEALPLAPAGPPGLTPLGTAPPGPPALTPLGNSTAGTPPPPMPGGMPNLGLPPLQQPQLQMPNLGPLNAPQLGPVPQLPQFQTFAGTDRLPGLMGEAAYQADRARWFANPLGAVGNPEDRARAEAVAANAGQGWLSLAAAQGDDPNKLKMQGLLGQMDLAKAQGQLNLGAQKAQADLLAEVMKGRDVLGGQMLGAQAQLGAANLAAQGHIQGAKLAADAANSPHAGFNQAMGALITGMAAGQVSPEALKSGIELLQGAYHRPGFGGAQAPAGPGAAPAPGRPPEQVIGELARQTQLGQTAGGAFLGEGGKPMPNPGIAQGMKFLEGLAAQGVKLDSPEFKGLRTQIQSGKFGDPQQVIDAIAQATARANLRVQPPSKNGQPINWGTAGPADIPGMVGYVGPSNRQIMSLGVAPSTSRLETGLGVLTGNRGIPYDTITLANGRKVKVNPSDLGQGWTRGANLPSAEGWQNQAGYGNALLEYLLAGGQ